MRALSIDAVEAADSGNPGLSLAMAEVATVLWTRFLKFDAADPRWQDRDRFVLSAAHGSMLLYSLLHLTGHAGIGIEDLKRFRQLHSPAAGHPEYGEHPAIEITTGPLGQGMAGAVGMALAERMLAARFGRSLVDHRTWVVASDGDLMEGVSHEAIGLAGHLRLEKLVVLYEDSAGRDGGEGSFPCSDDQLKRFAAHGWAVKRVDAHDPAQISGALGFALRAKKPTLIACRTMIGRRAGHSDEERASKTDIGATRAALDWDDPPFAVPPALADRWLAAGNRGAAARRAWLKRAARHPLRAEFDRVMAGRLPESWYDAIGTLKAETARARPTLATREASQHALEALAPALPELIGGAAEFTGSTLSRVKGMAPIIPGYFAGRYVDFGVREHGMAACLNGIAVHGGLIPFGGTFLTFSDYLRPALRLAALMRQRVIYVLSHDSIGLGEDGPTHQPVEQLAGLRAMPNVHVYRPADALETAECWELAIRWTDGPSLLVLTRQKLPTLRSTAGENRCSRGGYVLAEADGARQVTLIATGSEVSIAMAAREALAAEGVAAAVVSLPCWEVFSRQDAAYRESVLGGVPRIGIEAACGFGWERWLGDEGCFIGMSGFGASAPYEDLYRYFGITPEAIVAAARKRLG